MEQLRERYNKYLNQAVDFLRKTNSTIKIEYSKTDLYFSDDKCPRDIYNITISRGTRKYTFTFGNSIVKSKRYIYIENKNEEFGLNGYNIKGRSSCNNITWLTANCKLVNGTPPNEYDILSCLEKYEYNSFEDFCNELGYDTDSKKAEKIYNAVKEQYLNIISLYNDKEMELLREIR